MKRLKLFFACLLMAVLSIGQVWAVEYDALYESGTFSSLDAFGYTQNKTFTLNEKGWKASVAQVNSSVFYLGCNSSNAAKGVLNNNSDFSDIVTALASADATYNTNKTTAHAYALLFNNSYDNVTKVEFTWDGGNNAFQVYLFGYTGTAWTKLANTNYATSGAAVSGSVTWTGSATNYSKFAIAARPGTTSGTATNKTIRPATFKIYKTKAAAYTITAVSNNDLWGTVSGTTTITATPASGYRVKAGNAGYTVTSGTATVTNNGDNTFSVTPSANCTVQINFEAIPTYTVTWNNNGSTSTTQVVEGAKPTFPAKPASCATDCDKFYGWATEAWTGKLTDISGKTIHTSNATMDAVTAEGTVYYAVFTDVVATDYSTTYTSNVTLPSSGTNVSSATLVIGENDDIDAFKLGKSGAGATSSFIVPSGTTKIYLHAAAWNGKTVSLTLATDVGSISPDDAQDLTSNSGIANSSPFTLNTTGTGFDFDDLFFEYTLENVDEEAEITVTASGERAVIWGVNAVASASSGDAHYMTTCAACTHLVDAPELDGTIAVTHNTATINWKTLTNASSYDVTVIRNSDSESIFSGNVNALTKALTGLDPETQYDYSIMGVGDGSTYCTTGNGVLEGSFTTDALPTAKLYLVQLKDETPIEDGTHTVGVEFDLPTSAAICGKTLVGWTTETYENYTHATTAPAVLLKKYTFASTDDVTLYAVYANVDEDAETITPSDVAEGDDPHAITINKSGYTLSANKNTGSTAPAWNSGASDVRIYAAGDITLASTSTMTRIVFNLSAQGKKRLAPITASVGTIATQAANDETVTWTGSATSVTFTVGATADYGSDGSTKAGQLCFSNIDVTVQGEFSNYSTTCVDAPVATPSPAALNDVAVAGASGTITMTYEHVNASGVAVSLWNNAACTEAFEGSWLTASLDGDKNITYTIAENTSYNDARSAYIRLIAPETSGAASPAVVVIPVTQAKKAAVFASLDDLVAAELNDPTNVTVSFSNVPIKSIYYYPNNTSENNRKGVVFDIQKAGQDIKIYYNAKVSEEWVAGGKLSGTLTNCPWKIYGGGWQLAPTGEWGWNNLTYTAPAEIASIEIRGTATAKTYIDGQEFVPTGLSVIAIYDNSDEEDVTAYATWTYDPAKLSEDDTEVEVTAEYNSMSDTKTVDGLTVNPIPTKTIAEFIEAGGTRCYLEGTVSNITNTTYGNFTLTDATSMLVYGCLNQSGETKKFASLNISEGDKIKVIAETYDLTNTRAVNVQFVSKVSPVEITITSAQTVEQGKTLNLTATTDPEGAIDYISYSIKVDGNEGNVSLNGAVLTGVELGEATIIASIEDGEGYLANEVEFTVTVTPAIVRTGIYAKVTSNDDLTDGEYLIVYETGSLAFNGSLTTLDATSNNFAVTIESERIIATAEIDAKSFTIDVTAGTIKSSSGYYIGRTANSNGLNSSTTEAYVNTISIDNDGNAVIVGSGTTATYLRYNSDSNQKRFRYFTANQQTIQLYKKMDYTRSVSGNYGTICLPNNGVLTNGTLYEVAYFDAGQSKIFFDEVLNGEMVAGRPYIFLPNDGEDILKVTYMDEANAAAGNYRGLWGSYTETQLDKDGVNYILYNNQYCLVNSEAYVGKNRAYIKIGGGEGSVPTEAQPAAHGRRRVSMNVTGKQTATGVDELNASEAPIKVIIDGQLYILRGEKMYDATGRLVR